ncbi:hypothetical protein JCM5353_004691 [Sporobolomyces roseus]
MCMSTLFEDKSPNTCWVPEAISHSLDPLQYVKTVTIPDSDVVSQFLPRLSVFPNLEKLTLSNDWQYLDELFPHTSAEARPEADSDSSDEDEDDDDSDMEEEEEYRRKLQEEEYRRKLFKEAIQSALKALRITLPRLIGFSIGTARHIESLIALFDLLDPSKIKTLTFGTSGKHRPRYQKGISQPEFIAALDRFAHLEELTIGFRPRLSIDFSEHIFTFNKTLKRLKVDCLKYDENVAQFLGGLQSLERLELRFTEDSVSDRSMPSTLALPNLTFLSIMTIFDHLGKVTSGISQTLESFASAPKLRNILIDFGGDPENCDDGLAEDFDDSDLAKLLRPLCSTEIFPQLNKVEFDERAADWLSIYLGENYLTDVKPEQLARTRPDLRIELREDPSRKDYWEIVSPYSDDRKLDAYRGPESKQRQFCLDESEALLRWGLTEIANMRNDSRNRDKIGTTSEARRLMDALKELGKIKRISED